MTTPNTPDSPYASSTPPGAVTTAGPTRTRANTEIKLISHSNLFYWWPVWALAFFMAAWTYFENNRLAIVPPHSSVTSIGDRSGKFQLEYKTNEKDPNTGEPIFVNKTLDDAAKRSATPGADKLEPFKARISSNAAFGSFFVVVLILVIIITNVPLRGLWSFIVIMMAFLVAVIVSLLNLWDKIFETVGDLHIHINMAGYLTIGVAVFILWALATWVFDQRAYVIFTPGQIKVCEHIGDAVQTYPTMGISMEKQRDDLFRHYILGFGSGDLILKLGSGDKREIRLPNVLGIGWRLKTVEDMLRTMSTSN